MERYNKPKTLKIILTTISKDLTLDYRRPIYVITQIIFSIGSGVLVGIIQRTSTMPPEHLLPISLSIVTMFLATYSSYSSFLREKEHNTIDALRLAPIPPEAIFIAKTIYSTIHILASSLIFLLSSIFFANITIQYIEYITLWILVTSILLGSISSLVSSIMVYSESQSTLTPLLLLVLSLPYFNASSLPIQTLVQGYMPPPGWIATLTSYSIGLTLTLTLLSKIILE